VNKLYSASPGISGNSKIFPIIHLIISRYKFNRFIVIANFKGKGLSFAGFGWNLNGNALDERKKRASPLRMASRFC
jgi:hypothetical protein